LVAAAKSSVEEAMRKAAEIQRGLFGEAMNLALSELDDDLLETLLAAGGDAGAASLCSIFDCHFHVDFERGSALLVRLLELGAPIDAEPVGLRTVLGCSVHKNRLDFAEFLLERGSDVRQIDRHGQTLLHIAMLGRGDAYMFQFLAVRGVDVEARDNNGNTALHAAVATDKGQRDGERVRLLVGAGIDVNAVNSLGETPLHFAAAVRNGRDAAIVLLELGADATARTATGASAMHAAVQIEAKCDVSLFIKALIAHGADVDARTNDGNTPLVCLVANTEHTAARDDLLRLLHKLGADINATNNAGETAFGIAADVSDMGCWASTSTSKSSAAARHCT
jgi:ankyrin repeat protein